MHFIVAVIIIIIMANVFAKLENKVAPSTMFFFGMISTYILLIMSNVTKI